MPSTAVESSNGDEEDDQKDFVYREAPGDF